MPGSSFGSAWFEAGGPYRGVVETGSGQVGALKLGALKVGPVQICSAQIRTAQVRILQIGVVKVGTSQPSPLKVCLAEVSVFQIGALQLGSGHLGTGEVGVPEQCIRQPGVIQEGAAQVDARQVQLQLITACWAPAQHRHGCLHVGGAVLQPGELPVNGWCRMLGPLWRANEPGGMGTDICTEDGLDGASVRWRVRSDAFQGVEAAKAHVLLVVAELIDRTAESLGDLALSADLELPPSGDRADDQQEAGDTLQQRGTSVVLQLRLPLLQLNASFRVCDNLQFAGGQRRMQQPRKRQYRRQQQHYGPDRQRHQPGSWLFHPGSSLPDVTGPSVADSLAWSYLAILAFGLKWVDGYGVGVCRSGLLRGSRFTATWTRYPEHAL